MVIEPGTSTVRSSTPVQRVGREVVLVLDLAHELLEQVVDGDDPGRPAVLVDHDGDLGAARAARAAAPPSSLVVGHDQRLARELAHRPVPPPRAGQQVAEVHDADQAVERLPSPTG